MIEYSFCSTCHGRLARRDQAMIANHWAFDLRTKVAAYGRPPPDVLGINWPTSAGAERIRR
jgi:hypothetical protein